MTEFAWNSRKAIRVAFELQTSFRLNRSSKKDIHLNAKTIPAKLVDLSIGGCGLESATFVPAGGKINIFIDRNLLHAEGAKGSVRHFAKITGVVRNSRQLPNRAYRLGIQFEKISSEDKKLVQDFVGRSERREEKRILFS